MAIPLTDMNNNQKVLMTLTAYDADGAAQSPPVPLVPPFPAGTVVEWSIGNQPTSTPYAVLAPNPSDPNNMSQWIVGQPGMAGGPIVTATIKNPDGSVSGQTQQQVNVINSADITTLTSSIGTPVAQ